MNYLDKLVSAGKASPETIDFPVKHEVFPSNPPWNQSIDSWNPGKSPSFPMKSPFFPNKSICQATARRPTALALGLASWTPGAPAALVGGSARHRRWWTWRGRGLATKGGGKGGDFGEVLIFWLVVWLPSILFSQKYWFSNHPNWRSYFSEGWPNHEPVLVAHFAATEGLESLKSSPGCGLDPSRKYTNSYGTPASSKGKSTISTGHFQ